MAQSLETNPEVVLGVYRKVVQGEWTSEYDQYGAQNTNVIHKPSDDIRSHLLLHSEIKFIDTSRQSQLLEAIDAIEGGEVPELVDPLSLSVRSLSVYSYYSGYSRIVAHFKKSDQWNESRQKAIALFPWILDEAPKPRRCPSYMVLTELKSTADDESERMAFGALLPDKVELAPTKLKRSEPKR